MEKCDKSVDDCNDCKMVKFLNQCIKLPLYFTCAFLLFLGSIFINILQLLNYAAFEFTFPWLRRNINYYLQDIILNQATLILEWHSGVRFRLFFADEETKRLFGREPTFALGNHRLQIDAIFYWICCEMTNILGSAKAYAKNELKYLPVLGWTFIFSDCIFLRRNWKKDVDTISPAIQKLMSYPYPTALLLLAEGTRFTKEKYDTSQEFIKEHNLDIKLKHHLLPRVKGFEKSLRTYQEKYHGKFGVFNIQVISRSLNEPEISEPNVKTLIEGKPFKVDCYIERIPNGELPDANDPEEVYQKFLFKVFERKDELMELHKEYNCFPKAIKIVKKTSFWRFARFFFLNFALAGSFMAYLLYNVYLSQSLVLRFTVLGFILSVAIGGFVLIKQLGNSQYGTNRNDKKIK